MKDYFKRRQTWKMTLTSMTVISLNVNSLKAPTKRYKVEIWIGKMNPTFCCLQGIQLKNQSKHRLKDWKLISQANNSLKKAGVAILLDDTNFKFKKGYQRIRGSFLNDQGYTHQINHTPKYIFILWETRKYIRQLLINFKDIHCNTIAIGGFNTFWYINHTTT